MFYKVGLSLLTTATLLTGSTNLVHSEPVPVVEEQVEEQKKEYIGKGFNKNEAFALKYFQKQGITDRMALAVILGNIRQESTFVSNICEGGARIPYHKCYTGGYGLIQWTTVNRYDGLGRHAKAINGDPSSFETQLSYLVTEVQWKRAYKIFSTPNKSLDFYMKGAYSWLGWGHYGNRGYYSQQYYDNLTFG
jgi:hypothetical protein